jgi:hypothetical protein
VCKIDELFLASEFFKPGLISHNTMPLHLLAPLRAMPSNPLLFYLLLIRLPDVLVIQNASQNASSHFFVMSF